jgi:hypothetical protein
LTLQQILKWENRWDVLTKQVKPVPVNSVVAGVKERGRVPAHQEG